MKTLDTTKAEPWSLEDYRAKVVDAGTHVVGMNDTPVRVLCTDFLHNGAETLLVRVRDKQGDQVYIFQKDGHSVVSMQNQLFLYPKPPVSLGWVVVFQFRSVITCTNPFPSREKLIGSLPQAITLLSEPVELFTKP